MTELSSPGQSGDNGSSGLSGAGEGVRDMTDAGLVTAMTATVVDALAEAYDRHGRFVYGLGLRLSGQRQAEAMTREVFLALWRSPTDFVKPAGSLRATLMADLHHRAAIWLRSQHSRQRGETSQVVSDRSAIHLAYFRGYTYNQIAALLGRPEAAVAAELHAQLRGLATQVE